jgi:hypothetical protein
MRYLVAAAVILILFGPIIGPNLGIHPAIPPIVGVACGCAALVRGAPPLLPPRGGAPSMGAEWDAKFLSDHTVERPPDGGPRITDI